MKDHYDFSHGKRGAVMPPPPNKVPISIRLDPDVLDWFKSQVKGGGSYQALINQALREHMESGGAAMRDELARAQVRHLADAMLKTLQTLRNRSGANGPDAKALDAISEELAGAGIR
ncbi:MAG: BrnA antitoxin family protein [Nitrospirae bacterium]|nr:BrnA antitoxin family protein [Nitrospirota bacterium]